MIDTSLLGAGGLDRDPAAATWLRAVTRLELRGNGQRIPASAAASRGTGPSRIEVRAQDGCMLGHLPPDDAEEVAALLATGASARLRVRGIVPAFRRPRVQLAVELEAP